MAIDFFEGLASTVNDVLNPLFDLASKIFYFFFPRKVDRPINMENIEPFR